MRNRIARVFAGGGSTVVGVVLLLVVGLMAGVAIGDGGGSGDVFTACLSDKGEIDKVALGSEPAKACKDKETQITWNQTGPQGPVGPEGPPGSGGELSLYTVVADNLPDLDVPVDLPTEPTYLSAYSYMEQEPFVATCDPGDPAIGGWVHKADRFRAFDASGTTEEFNGAASASAVPVLDGGLVAGFEALGYQHSGHQAVASHNWSWDPGSMQGSEQLHYYEITLTCLDVAP